MHRSLRSTAVAVVSIALLLGGAGTAIAGTSYSLFSAIVPKFQFPYVGVSAQSKSTSSKSGDIQITSVGSTYKTDVTECVAYGANCSVGTKVYNLTDGSTAKLPNTIASGNVTVTPVFQISTWNAVDVQVIGSWRSN